MSVSSRAWNVGRLLLKPYRLYAATLLPFVMLLGCWVVKPGSEEWWVRVDGFVLTLFGAALVVRGIRSNRVVFNRPTEVQVIGNWLREIGAAARGRQEGTLLMAGTARVSFGVHAATLTVKAGPGSSLKQRIELLEQNVRQLEERIGDADRQVRVRMDALDAAVASERAAREQADTALSSRLEEIAVGSFDLDWTGVVWIVIGSFFSTFPTGVAEKFMTFSGLTP